MYQRYEFNFKTKKFWKCCFGFLKTCRRAQAQAQGGKIVCYLFRKEKKIKKKMNEKQLGIRRMIIYPRHFLFSFLALTFDQNWLQRLFVVCNGGVTLLFSSVFLRTKTNETFIAIRFFYFLSFCNNREKNERKTRDSLFFLYFLSLSPPPPFVFPIFFVFFLYPETN